MSLKWYTSRKWYADGNKFLNNKKKILLMRVIVLGSSVRKHCIGLPLQIIGAIAGLFVYVVVENYLRGRLLSSLDNKYVFLVGYVGGISVIIFAALYYSIFLRILKSKRIAAIFSFADALTSGILLGFVFLPSMYVVILIEHIPGMEKVINPFVQIIIVLVFMGILSIALTMAIFIILISRRKRLHSDRSR